MPVLVELDESCIFLNDLPESYFSAVDEAYFI